MRIFIGYPSELRTIAFGIADLLSQREDTVWIDRRSLVGGDTWDAVRLDAQRKAEFVVHVIASGMLNRSGPVHREIRETLRLLDDQPFGWNFALFLRADEFRMPVDLQHIHYLNLYDPGWQTELIRAVDKRRGQLFGAAVADAPRKFRSPIEIERVGVEERADGFSREANYFHYIGGSEYWRFVSSSVEARSLGSYYRSSIAFRPHDPDEKERANPSYHTVRADEFFREDELVSVRYYIRWYGSGAAHPNHGIVTDNFFGSSIGDATLSDLVGDSRDAALSLLNYCIDRINEKYRDSSGKSPHLLGHHGALANPLDALRSYNFDAQGLTFNFSPYEMLAYAYGAVEIAVPWDVVRPHLRKPFTEALAILLG